VETLLLIIIVLVLLGVIPLRRSSRRGQLDFNLILVLILLIFRLF